MAGLSLCALQASAQDGRVYSVRDTLDRHAEFPGGYDRMIDYINLHISNPKATGYDEPVYCTFMVMPYGEIDYGSIEFLRKLGDGSLVETIQLTQYEKALRNAIKEIPGFVAAEADGERVPYLYALLINATLDDYASVKTPEPKGVATATAKERAEYKGGTRKARKRADGVYTMWDKVDRTPQFPDGAKALYKALNANLKRPHFYSHQKVIFCSFVVRENGEIDRSTIKCVHKKDTGTYVDAPQYTTWENAVMESVKQLPDFLPAKVGGKAVPYEYILPVSFK